MMNIKSRNLFRCHAHKPTGLTLLILLAFTGLGGCASDYSGTSRINDGVGDHRTINESVSSGKQSASQAHPNVPGDKTNLAKDSVLERTIPSAASNHSNILQTAFSKGKIVKAVSGVVPVATNDSQRSGARIGVGAAGGSGGSFFGGVGLSLDLGTLIGLISKPSTPSNVQTKWTYELQDIQTKMIYVTVPTDREYMINSCVSFRPSVLMTNGLPTAEILSVERCSEQ